MSTKIILSAVVALFVISLVLVITTNIENNQFKRISRKIKIRFLFISGIG